MPQTYKQLVTQHLQRAVDAGLTQQQIAERLGLRHGSYVSMPMSPRCPNTLLSPCRAPALARLCGLSALEQLQLVHRRIADFPDAAVQLSTELLSMVMTATVQEVARRRRARASAALAHGH